MNLAVGFNPLVSTQIMFNRIPPAGAGGSFNPSLQYLHKLCSTESHRREPVDRSIPAYNIYTNYVQPNPAGGSRWIVQSQPTISTQIMFNRIPPAGAGGSFNPSLQGLGRFPRIPPPAGGGSFKSNLL